MGQVEEPPSAADGRRWLALTGTPLSPSIWSAVAKELDGPLWAPDVSPAAGTPDPQGQVASRIAARLRPAGGRWSVVGHSFGGQVAIEFALAAPDLVDHVALVGTRDTPFPPFAATADALATGQPVDVGGALARWLRPAEIDRFPTVVDDLRAQLENADRSAWATALRGIARFDASRRIGAITGPVTVLAAEYDPVSTPDAMAEMAGRLPGSTFAVWPDAAHLSPFLYPARLAGLLRRVPGAAGG